MEKQVNNPISIYLSPFTARSFDDDCKILPIEEEPGNKSEIYNTAQVKPYLGDPEEVAVNFISLISMAIAWI